ncbi:hypothetical protein BCU68_00275 [Vibrio sp. 10N.286.49.B3]|nr:DUF2987 domain-containing protein [Vibrio sp. 10N.286.49.B3]PMH46522.1 hypothetical protein BCU68_00275 [Vibrio sp. 10N.286.49.B3]
MIKRSLGVRLLTLVFSALVILPIQAQEYMFTYSKLYGQIKHNNNEELDRVKVGLFFIHQESQQLCTISKAWMEKEEHYESFVIPDNNELPLPLDANLRSANPLVFVQLLDNKQCDYSMVVMTKEPFSGSVGQQEVSLVMSQMQTLLAELSGLFSRWFTPEISGITLEFATIKDGEFLTSEGNKVAIVNGKSRILLSDLSSDESLLLPEKTRRVLPYIL